jgi:hypothetical protein
VNLHGHACERVGYPYETTGYGNGLPDVAYDGDWYQIVAADTLRLVGSKVIQPAPGTKTSAHAWVDPDSLDPTLCWSG